MDSTETSIFTNMCMIYDDKGNVLVQGRVNPIWKGIAFPGWHVKFGEPFTDAVIREVYEETGLTVSELKLFGIKDWIRDDGTRYIVHLCKNDCIAISQIYYIVTVIFDCFFRICCILSVIRIEQRILFHFTVHLRVMLFK